MQSKTYHIKTFGCQMNVRDSQTAAGILEGMGYAAQEDIAQADIVLFNTCCIRDLAEKKAESAIGAAREYKRRRGSIIGVFGCMTQQEGVPDRLADKFPFLDFIIGTNNLHALPGLLQAAKEGRQTLLIEQGSPADDFDLPARPDAPPLAYVNIMFGCNNFCSYCIVPYVRGREASRPRGLILDELRKLADGGYSEVTLLGQNVNSYGKDMDDSFADLLRAADKTGIRRIRFMTSHPKDLSENMIAAMAECDSVCAQLHLPVQSGSDAVLRAMNRRYDSEHYIKLVEKLRSAMPNIGLSTDIIVGFPGESEADFEDTLRLVRQLRFDSAYTFAFSPRKGTKAAELPGQLDAGLKQQRLQRLIDLQAGISMEVHESLVGSGFEVLAEGVSRKDASHLTGRLERGITVNFPAQGRQAGDMIKVRIEEAKRNTLFGSII